MVKELFGGLPTVLLDKSFCFFFYSNENNEPAHTHVTNGEGDGKVWLAPTIEIAYLLRFTNSQQREFEEITLTNENYFK